MIQLLLLSDNICCFNHSALEKRGEDSTGAGQSQEKVGG